MKLAAHIFAILLFVLAALAVHVDSFSWQELVAVGLASFALGNVLP